MRASAIGARLTAVTVLATQTGWGLRDVDIRAGGCKPDIASAGSLVTMCCGLMVMKPARQLVVYVPTSQHRRLGLVQIRGARGNSSGPRTAARRERRYNCSRTRTRNEEFSTPAITAATATRCIEQSSLLGQAEPGPSPSVQERASEWKPKLNQRHAVTVPQLRVAQETVVVSVDILKQRANVRVCGYRMF